MTAAMPERFIPNPLYPAQNTARISSAERSYNMKKLFAIILAAALMLTLTGCLGRTGTSSTPTESPDAKEASAYEKSFDGLKKYLTDHALVSSDAESEVYYDILGADNGVRYILSNTAFIELYDFSSADNDTASAVLADVADDGKLTSVAGLDEMAGVVSGSGKFLALYKAKNSYDYAKITDELGEW